MEKETVLEIEFMPVWDKWAWRITKQNENVLERGVFKDDEIRVMSSSGPCLCLDNFLYIKGMDSSHDDDCFVCTNKEKKIIKEKVKAINEKYEKPKRWRAEYGGEYFFVTSHGKVRAAIDYKYDYDTNRYNFGNYFKTKEQAKKALGRMKEVLKEVTE
ncbi:hypothetical protein FSBG_00164 [Fusobacterium gonidiaformans 3-1-5R]|uniref:Uncharacterized protein n=1 Tax=Fusobacterium gonidiaformans 3-1-5R TaxID=469605 RepID=E5BEY6_9FUSO|nr:hypothetical protein [Fusobacterium gonidiaformans]EFS20667.1 hypothetical protein FSBG_00164 [Fusobacterium gonidiaformans 3-1-5R]